MEKIQKYHQSSLNGFIETSKIGKLTSVEQVLKSDEPSFVRLKTEQGPGLSKSVILAGVKKMADLVDADLNNNQLVYLCEYIEREYFYLTLSELNIITEWILQQKNFGKPTLATIIKAINDYNNQRSEMAITINVKKKKEIESDLPTPEQVKKMYQQVKEEKHEQKKRSDKLREAIGINEEKIKELKRLYPEQFK